MSVVSNITDNWNNFQISRKITNFSRIKYEFVKLVVILFTFIQDVIMSFLLILPEKDSHCAWWKPT